MPGQWPDIEDTIFNTKNGCVVSPLEIQKYIYIVSKVSQIQNIDPIPTFEKRKDEWLGNVKLPALPHIPIRECGIQPVVSIMLPKEGCSMYSHFGSWSFEFHVLGGSPEHGHLAETRSTSI